MTNSQRPYRFHLSVLLTHPCLPLRPTSVTLFWEIHTPSPLDPTNVYIIALLANTPQLMFDLTTAHYFWKAVSTKPWDLVKLFSQFFSIIFWHTFALQNTIFTRSVNRCALPELNSVTRPNVHWIVFRNHISISRKEGLNKETSADLSERGKVGVLWTLVTGRIRRRWIGSQPVQLSQIRIYYKF